MASSIFARIKAFLGGSAGGQLVQRQPLDSTYPNMGNMMSAAKSDILQKVQSSSGVVAQQRYAPADMVESRRLPAERVTTRQVAR